MAASFPGNSRIFDRLRDAARPFRERPDSEHEQAAVRLAVISFVLLYVVFSSRRDGRIDAVEAHALSIALVFIMFSFGILFAIARNPAKSVRRRVLGMVADIGTTSYGMYFGGELCAPLYVILLWVTFGNGFRYGRKYLLGATVLSAVSFLAVILTNDYWRSHPTLAVGLLVGLLILPAYVSSLLKKLTDAVRRAEEANRAKNQFLANMSHEMRTPLNGVLGMVDLLRGTPLTPEQQDFSATIHASAQTLLFLIEDVLDISKIEAGKVTVDTVDVDLHSLVKGTVAMLSQQAREKGLRMSTQIPSRIPFQLRSDPLLLRQILLNLLGNAVKFTDEGEVCLRVEPVEETARSVTLRFEVTDTGIGIPLEAQSRIFDRFTQADDSITRRFGGTGLGTTIAKQLVELMGGEIGFRSEPGLGSAFWFTVRMERQPASAAKGAGTCDLEGSRVLIVSSDFESTAILQDHLFSWGIRATSVERAAQAFTPLVSAMNSGSPYDIAIIVERGLDMDAYDLGKALKSVKMIHAVQLILAGKEESEPDLNHITRHGYSAAVRAPLDKTLLFNALHFVRPEEHREDGIPVLASRYRQKLDDRPGLYVLVAEDNPTNQKVIVKILERAGHRVHLVGDGEQALDALDRHAFDLVLLDLQMPVMGGIEVASAYRFTRRQGARIPIVALTADATPEARSACEEAGFDAYVTKPVEAKKLLDVIVSLAPAVRTAQGEGEAAHGAAGGHAPPEKRPVPETIDPAIFQELASLGGKSDFLEKLVGIFLAGGEQKIEDIEKALLSQNYGLVADLAHALKGSAGQIGAVPLMDLCHKLSRTGPSGLMKEGHDQLLTLKEEFERVRYSLGQQVRRGKGRPSPSEAKPQNGGSGVSFPHSFRNR